MASAFNDYYSHENHGPFELFDLGNFPLEEAGRCMTASSPIPPRER